MTNDSGSDAGEKYLDQFEEGERRQMYLMSVLIQERGLENVRKMATNGLEIVDE
ncbi:MAG: hypothetical protein KDC72_08650 [Bacteroidetes bacterium]|nr:hypothetical protein [Bacteroidota bacterium]